MSKTTKITAHKLTSSFNDKGLSFVFMAMLGLVAIGLTACHSGGGSGGSSNNDSSKLSVASISPIANETGVALDKEITVIFSQELDAIQPDDIITVHDSIGQVVSGSTFVNQRALIFSPDRYQGSESFTVTISAQVRSDNLTLEQPFESSFKTGERLLNGKQPPAKEYNPLGLVGNQISLGTIPEVAMVWSNNVQTNFVVQDPPYNPSPMVNPSSPDATELSHTMTASSLQQIKIPVSGQFDDDKWDETAVFSHDGSGTGTIRLTIIDTIANHDYIENALAFSFGTAESIAVAAADFDADGRDEILIVTSSRARPTIDYSLIDYDSVSGRYQIEKQGSITPETADEIVNVQVAAGDVDADGKPEAVFTWVQDTGVVVAYYQIKYNEAYSSFAVLDDLRAGMVGLSPQRQITAQMKLSAYAPYDSVAVTTGDIDGDGAEEVLIGLTQYDDSGTTGSNTNDPNYRYCSWIRDSLFVAQNSHADAVSSTLELRQIVPYNSNGWSEAFEDMGARTFFKGKGLMSVLKTADLDGDGRQELLFHNVLTKFKGNGNVKSVATPEPQFMTRIPQDKISTAYSYDGIASRAQDLSIGYFTTDIQVGDIDGDLKDDFVLLRRANRPDGTKTLDYLGNPMPNGIWIEHFDFADCAKEAAEDYCAGFDPVNPDIRLAWKKIALQGSSSLYWWIGGEPKLVLPNVDEDSIIVEKAGHSVYTSKNTIVAVLAAPPCSEAIGQDVGNCSTEFGHGSTQSFEHGAYVNASAGVLFGLEWEPEVNIPFMKIKLAKIELEGSMGVEYAYQHNWGLETSELITYSAGADNNLVIFDSYVYDRYQYRILSHPDSSLIGTNVNVSLPTGRRQLAVSQEYYNASNGSQMDIDASILTVVPGDLNTYPNRSDAESIASGIDTSLVAMAKDFIQVPQGGSNSVSYETGVSTSESNDHSVGAYFNLSLKACGPDASGLNPSVCLGIEGSTSGGYAYSHTWSKDLIFTGSVTGIPGDRFFEEKFGLGLFVYKQNVPGNGIDANQQFIVVNYFLDK